MAVRLFDFIPPIGGFLGGVPYVRSGCGRFYRRCFVVMREKPGQGKKGDDGQ
jgi:hypothetical protein